MWRAAARGVTPRIKTSSAVKPVQQRCMASGPPPQKGGVLKWFVLLPTAALGGAAAYGEFVDPEFKKVMEKNVYSPFQEYVYDPIMGLVSGSGKAAEEEPKPLAKITPTPQPQTVVKKSEPKTEPVKSTVKETPSPAPAQPSLSAKEREKLDIERKLQQQREKEKAENTALESKLKDLMDSCKTRLQEASDLQKDVIESVKQHSKALQTAMDDKTDILNKEGQWQAVSEAFQKREGVTDNAKKVMESLRSEMDKLKSIVDDARNTKSTKSNKVLNAAQEAYNTASSKLNAIQSAIAKSESENEGILKFNDLVEDGKKKFQRELESLMPDVKPGKGKKLSEDELNSLIAHAHRRIEQLQHQLANHMALEKERIQEALESQKRADDKVCDRRIQDESQKIRNSIDLEKRKWEEEAQVQHEVDLRQQLARQAAAHSDHLQEVLKVQEQELLQKYERQFNLKFIEERQAFQAEIAGWVARLKGIETAVESRAAAEKIAREAQDLWLASLALNGSIRRGKEEELEWEARLKPLGNEIVAVYDAAGNHPFVNVIVSTIPEKAYVRGVWTEDTLRERFEKVSSVCKKVAAIDECGGTLYKYFISYLQSAFISFKSYDIKGLNDQVDIASMDNFEILANANFWMERGDFETAVRFMNQLQGEAKKVASDWLKEAKLLLETRQAAIALTAFASASGLGTVF
ncbi:MICOS complex subunit Mic60-like isoform X3 [Saccostrea cucullata]|uniref:MICOS complex subunit Mic60-like isoform X3 n=1 Tax=Saccostrea cuccullata TaxID=36930 RepID=UPI002ED65451